VKRWDAGFWVCLAVAPAWGFSLSLLGDRLDWSPLVASISPLALVAFAGWLHRGRDPIDVFPPAVAIAFAAFVGLALARAVDGNLVAATYGAGPLYRYWPVPVTSWPIVLLGGVVYAFVFAILGALPASRLAPRPKIDLDMDRRFWTFVKEHTQPDERSP
jgi:hypothetical protein